MPASQASQVIVHDVDARSQACATLDKSDSPHSVIESPGNAALQAARHPANDYLPLGGTDRSAAEREIPPFVQQAPDPVHRSDGPPLARGSRRTAASRRYASWCRDGRAPLATARSPRRRARSLPRAARTACGSPRSPPTPPPAARWLLRACEVDRDDRKGARAGEMMSRVPSDHDTAAGR